MYFIIYLFLLNVFNNACSLLGLVPHHVTAGAFLLRPALTTPPHLTLGLPTNVTPHLLADAVAPPPRPTNGTCFPPCHPHPQLLRPHVAHVPVRPPRRRGQAPLPATTRRAGNGKKREDGGRGIEAPPTTDVTNAEMVCIWQTS